eukprot:5614820-Heterocapsa_arctica.AAC.1
MQHMPNVSAVNVPPVPGAIPVTPQGATRNWHGWGAGPDRPTVTAVEQLRSLVGRTLETHHG